MISRFTVILPVALAALLMSSTLCAQEDTSDDSKQRIADLEDQVEQLGSAYEELMRLFKTLEAQANRRGDVVPEDEFYIPRQAAAFPTSGRTGNLGDIYSKPFLAEYGGTTYIGGYIDLEYSDPSGGGSKEFDQHRFVPFIYSDISDSIKVAAEIEVEHGHELEVEFAQMDFLLNPHANLRAGIQLLPLGKFNEVHDSPIQELTFRPLVNTYVIPTTLRDAGLGLWGDVTETVSYHATVTNGFRGLGADGTSAITNEKGLRDAAPHKDKVGDPFENINDDLAYAGRLSWRPMLGLETGISGLVDHYDEAGDNSLKIWAFDATLHGQAVPILPDNMEILYEGAWVDVQRDTFAHDSGVAGDMDGHYVQTNVHFAPDFLTRDPDQEGGLIEDGAHFTFVTRYGSVELDDYTMRRTTLGLNFRPNESDTVIKLDYLMNDDKGALSGDNDDNVWALSFASYF